MTMVEDKWAAESLCRSRADEIKLLKAEVERLNKILTRLDEHSTVISCGCAFEIPKIIKEET
jgi:hypothetical protein